MTATTNVTASVRDATRAWLATATGSAVGRLVAIWLVLAVVLTLLTPTFLTVGNFLLIAQSVAIAGVAAVGLTVAVVGGLGRPVVPSDHQRHDVLPRVAAERRLARAAGRRLGPLPRAADRARERSPQSVLEDRCAVADVGYIYVPARGAVHPYEWPNDAGSGLAHRSARPLYGRRSPILVITLALVGLVAAVALHWTVGGQWVSAVGGNPAAASFSGIPTYRVAVLALGVSGLAAAIAGVMLTGLVGFASTNNGDVYLLPVIAAVVLSGASLTGGKGSNLIATLIAVARSSAP